MFPDRHLNKRLAALILWSLVRAFRRGVINSGSGYSFTLDDRPMLFTLTAIVHAGGALFFAYIAAGTENARQEPRKSGLILAALQRVLSISRLVVWKTLGRRRARGRA
jgi:hypothetical protein